VFTVRYGQTYRVQLSFKETPLQTVVSLTTTPNFLLSLSLSLSTRKDKYMVCCLSKLYEYKTSVKQTVHVFYNKAASQIGKQC
jgi:hypothetical protein